MDQLGPYRIETLLGQGGMGVVYRALDTRLNRPVAVKLLSEDVADGAARRRFQREAQMASSLNHPHILTVLDAGDSEGRQYLVTEFIDGGTLKDWARAEKRDWRQIVDLLTGVADGLATAHAAGILHRDLKPANILITSTGYAKLADFGLAKLAPDGGDTSATLTLDATRPGVVVGTIAYMSPEQASGKPVDSRSDIFSFGVVLYEMLSGKRPFAGPTELETLQSVIHAEPAPLPADVPAELRMAVEKALAKDPEERYQSMRDLVVDLRRVSRLAPEHSFRPKWIRVAAAAAIVAAGAGVWIWLRPPGVPSGVEYAPLTNFADSVTSPAVSPDGKMLAFIRGEETFEGPGDIFVKLLPDGEPVQLTHDGRRKMSPAFSPNGTLLAYTVIAHSPNWDTWVVPVLGGEPKRLLPNAAALSWVDGGKGAPRVLFSEWGEGVHMSIMTSAEDRAGARAVYAPPSKDAMAHRSYLSPDGKSSLVVEMDGGWRPCRLVPFEGGSAGRTVGPAPAQCTTAAWSPDGRWMYFSANVGNGYHIWRQRYPDGRPEQITFGATEEEGIAFFPDGRSFATSIGTRQSTLWVHDSRGERQITSQGYGSLPLFSSDGRKLYYLLRSRSSRRFVSGELWAADLETGGHERLLPGFLMEHYDISADGRKAVFVAVTDDGKFPLWIADLDRSSAPKMLSSIDSIRTFFGADGEILFLGNEGEKKFLYRIKEDGSGLQKALRDPITYFYGVHPGGKTVSAMEGDGVVIRNLDNGSGIQFCSSCGGAGGENRGITPPFVNWSRDGSFLYTHIGGDSAEPYAVPLRTGQVVPPLPASGVTPEQVPSLPGARRVSQKMAFVGATPDIYAFPRVTTQRNIYRVPVP